MRPEERLLPFLIYSGTLVVHDGDDIEYMYRKRFRRGVILYGGQNRYAQVTRAHPGGAALRSCNRDEALGPAAGGPV
jgi:hypothetical protein